MKLLFCEAKKWVCDASGISDLDMWWWKSHNGVFYPDMLIDIDDIDDACREFVESNKNLPQGESLDEIELHHFTAEQLEIRNWFLELFEKI